MTKSLLLPIGLLLRLLHATWLRVYNLYSQNAMHVVHILVNSFRLATGHQYRSGSGLPCLNLLSHSWRSQHRQKNDKTSLPRVFNVSIFRVVFNPDLPPFWKISIHWCLTPLITKTSSLQSNRLALLHCHHILSKDHDYPYKDLVTPSLGIHNI